MKQSLARRFYCELQKLWKYLSHFSAMTMPQTAEIYFKWRPNVRLWTLCCLLLFGCWKVGSYGQEFKNVKFVVWQELYLRCSKLLQVKIEMLSGRSVCGSAVFWRLKGQFSSRLRTQKCRNRFWPYLHCTLSDLLYVQTTMFQFRGVYACCRLPCRFSCYISVAESAGGGTKSKLEGEMRSAAK